MERGGEKEEKRIREGEKTSRERDGESSSRDGYFSVVRERERLQERGFTRERGDVRERREKKEGEREMIYSHFLYC